MTATQQALMRSLERVYAEQRAEYSTMTTPQRAAFRFLEEVYQTLDHSPRLVARWAELLDEEMTR